jgi:phosphatidylserine/phosphatidylglycerophosphate/cardiolipin synthase-like enzyme
MQHEKTAEANMQQRTLNNTADFLLDGDNFFARFHQELTAIEALYAGPAPAAGSAYIRLMFWKAEPNTMLPAIPGQVARTVAAALTAVANAGCPIKIMLWQGLYPEVRNAWRAFQNALNGVANVEIYLDPYGSAFWNPAQSMHMKVALFRANNVLTGLVGGLNIGNSYMSPPAHTVAHYWHDGGCALQGPVCDTLEDLWRRRWNVANNQHPAVAASLIPQAPAMANGFPVTIATTETDAPNTARDIRPLILDQIDRAARYIYMENQVMTDPVIVEALAQKIARQPHVRVIIVVPHPLNTSMGSYAGYSYMMYYTYMTLALANVTSVTARRWRPNVNMTRTQIARGELSSLIPGGNSTIISGNNIGRTEFRRNRQTLANLLANVSGVNGGRALAWSEQRTFNWRLNDGTTGQTKFKNLSNIVAPPVMYSPIVQDNNRRWPYVHSKIALFDDRVAFVGSSNWTFRSMDYDGEITAMIEDPATATAIRTQIFNHWEAGLTPVNWLQRATTNLNNFGHAPPVAGQTYIVPLQHNDFHWWSLPAWGTWLLPRYF